MKCIHYVLLCDTFPKSQWLKTKAVYCSRSRIHKDHLKFYRKAITLFSIPHESLTLELMVSSRQELNKRCSTSHIWSAGYFCKPRFIRTPLCPFAHLLGMAAFPRQQEIWVDDRDCTTHKAENHCKPLP